MSILIKGMRMPENCAECKRARLQFYIKCEEHEYVSNGLKMKMRSLTCPMEELHPHGRLIDADLLCKVLQKNSEDEWNNKTAPFSWAYAYECVKDTVENMPTIIEAEGDK